MKGFMPEDMFDMLAVTAVKMHILYGDTLESRCTEMVKAGGPYPEDTALGEDVEEASRLLLSAVNKLWG